MQKRLPLEPMTPRHTDPARSKAVEKKNKWDCLAPPPNSPSIPPEIPVAADEDEMARSEKLLEEVAEGASSSSKSNSQESSGEGDMMIWEKHGERNQSKKKRKKEGESRAPCTP